MSDNTNCKGCGSSVRVSAADIKSMLDEMQLSNVDLVTEAIYRSRLATCRGCEYLDYRTTCRFCGCLVAIRAWLVDKHCPSPAASKW